jgi:ankyrin
MFGSTYSGVSYTSSFDPDNVTLSRQPVYSGFLVSFMVDARGGAMRGCRHSGIRIIVPPGRASMPTRVTCKLVRKEKLPLQPPLMEGEALASRVLIMGPAGAKFLGPVVLEVPHFASLRGLEREITVLRSDDGQTWREHTDLATVDTMQRTLCGSFEDLESAEDLYHRRITRIVTGDFPKYFALVSRITQDSGLIGPDGGLLNSTIDSKVQAVFPAGALTKAIKVGLQAHTVTDELVQKCVGENVGVSPVVTIEPRRRKFHRPITVTIPLPAALHGKQPGDRLPTLRLLCSITGANSATDWEDITGSTPLTLMDDCISFTTNVSARFWLIHCKSYKEAVHLGTEIYSEALVVPFMANFVVFARRRGDPSDGQLRVFCMTDDKMDKTLETQEKFIEIAKSRDLEVLDGMPQFIEVGGNLYAVPKSDKEKQLYINFRAFKENRQSLNVRLRDTAAEPTGFLAFMSEPANVAGQTPICTLNVTLPAVGATRSTVAVGLENGGEGTAVTERSSTARPARGTQRNRRTR